MLIIGHRGSKGTKPENTVASLRAAMEADADMIEIDIRLTRDGIPVLSHDLHLNGTRRRDFEWIRRYTLSELQKRTAGTDLPIITLDAALKECFGRIYLNIEIKELSAVSPTIEVIKRYAKKKRDWDSLLISSFKPLALRLVKQMVPYAALGMLNYRNPFAFIGWHRVLNLSAVGFHRLYVNTIVLEVAKRWGIFTYAYTVNRATAARKLSDRGIDGVVTDFPARMRKELQL